MMDLGAEFAEIVPIKDVDKKGPDPGVQLLLEVRAILAALPSTIAAVVRDSQPVLPPIPAPTVMVPEPDLSEIVMAVNGLKPGATAEDIGKAIARNLNPAPPTENTAMVDAMRELVEKIDFRLQGVGRAFGASGPSNISDNAQRQLGEVSIVGSLPAVSGAVGTASVAAPITGQTTWSSGGAAQLSATSHPITNGVLVQALVANTGAKVCVGASGVTLSTGYELQPGQAVSFTCADVDLLYVIGGTAGDGVCWSVL